MNKTQVKALYKDLDTDNFAQCIGDIETYHGTRSNYKSAKELQGGIHKAALKGLTIQQLEQLAKCGEEPVEDEGEDEGEGGLSDKAAADQAISDAVQWAVWEYFFPRIAAYEQQGIRMYVDIDISDNTCSEVNKDVKKYRETLVSRFLLEQAEGRIPVVQTGEYSTFRMQMDKHVADAVYGLLLRVRLYKEIPMFTIEEGELSYYKPKYQPDDKIDYKYLKLWFSGLSDPDALAAWIWGLYSCQYGGRFIMYVQGEAEVMKSLITKHLLFPMFGSAFKSLSANDMNKKNQFFMRMMKKMKIVVIPDNQDRFLYMSETTKEISGRDIVNSEGKGENAENIELECGMLVFSNYLPRFSSEGFAISRACPLVFKDPGLGFIKDPKDVIELEIPGFLAYAKDCYDRLCTHNYYIKLNDKTEALIESIHLEFESEYHEAVLDRLVMADNAFIRKSDFIDIMRRHFKIQKGAKDFKVSNFLDFLKRVHGVRLYVKEGYHFIKGVADKEKYVETFVANTKGYNISEDSDDDILL